HFALHLFIFTKITAFSCCVYCGRLDIVNTGSWESGYSECRVLGDQM
ncbi:unnamed protein product, partial [Staurois parvus]